MPIQSRNNWFRASSLIGVFFFGLPPCSKSCFPTIRLIRRHSMENWSSRSQKILCQFGTTVRRFFSVYLAFKFSLNGELMSGNVQVFEVVKSYITKIIINSCSDFVRIVFRIVKNVDMFLYMIFQVRKSFTFFFFFAPIKINEFTLNTKIQLMKSIIPKVFSSNFELNGKFLKQSLNHNLTSYTLKFKKKKHASKQFWFIQRDIMSVILYCGKIRSIWTIIYHTPNNYFEEFKFRKEKYIKFSLIFVKCIIKFTYPEHCPSGVDKEITDGSSC